MAEGVVFDLGYAPHEGPRLGRGGAVLAVYRDGLRRVLGLRRRARRKVFPALLIGTALLPALFFVAFGIIAGEFDPTATFFGHAEYFDLTGSVALVFIALAAAELIVPDRVNGTMAVYASRPLTTADYLMWRAASLATVTFGFLWLPHLVLFVGRAWVSDAGFGSYLTTNLEVVWETGLASLGYLVAYAPFAFLVAALSSRQAVAAAVFIGVVTFTGPTTRALVEAGFDVLGLGALQHHPGVIKDWILEETTHSWIPLDSGFDPGVSLVMILAIAALCALVVHARYRRAA